MDDEDYSMDDFLAEYGQDQEDPLSAEDFMFIEDILGRSSKDELLELWGRYGKDAFMPVLKNEMPDKGLSLQERINFEAYVAGFQSLYFQWRLESVFKIDNRFDPDMDYCIKYVGMNSHTNKLHHWELELNCDAETLLRIRNGTCTKKVEDLCPFCDGTGLSAYGTKDERRDSE